MNVKRCVNTWIVKSSVFHTLTLVVTDSTLSVAFFAALCALKNAACLTDAMGIA
ncbi:uncharacterized protein PHALS_03021 [Plasmopara halstedii]|uniref:Uncharacterized protein n=1 Tax=Plasmopara halstedii TaxID=4781 RepID=A0A0P1A772_PLAHL|nr:uncharacterized protein PHALS_03021 [Plasmopara halstedii]CEG36472.1 hypothetical protein PHALS_03021 [Plasmopara halstedii]|eukprot:XP_024572841.1 hypothetical protein PHALS_03021 [Plasmopara halstedii]